MLSNRRSHSEKWKIDKIQHQSPIKETAEVSKVKKAIKQKRALQCSSHLHLCPPANGRRQSGLQEDNVLKLRCTAWPVCTVAVVRRCYSVEMLMFLLIKGVSDCQKEFKNQIYLKCYPIILTDMQIQYISFFLFFFSNSNNYTSQLDPQIMLRMNRAFLNLNRGRSLDQASGIIEAE